MIVTEINGLRVLTPKSPRYIIYIKDIDVYSEKIYLGKYADLDNYEEIDKITLEENGCIVALAEEVDGLNNFFSEVQSIINE